MLKLNKCGRFDLAMKALEFVVQNYTTKTNIKGEDRHYRVGKVVARANAHIATYASKNREYEKYAEATQEGEYS